MELQNVEVKLASEHSDYSLSCEYKGLRYHVWLDRETRKMGDTLFKNPPLTAQRRTWGHSGSPDWFETRPLRIDAKFGREMVAEMMRIADAENLWQKAEEKIAEERRVEQEKRDRAIRLQRIKEAGPELLAALEAWEHWYSVDSTEELRDTARELGLAAIRKARRGELATMMKVTRHEKKLGAACNCHPVRGIHAIFCPFNPVNRTSTAALIDALVWATYPICRCGANTACDEPHAEDCKAVAAIKKAKEGQ